LSVSLTSDIRIGSTYQFRYRGRNSQGWGEFSDAVDIIAARKTDIIMYTETTNEEMSV